MALLDFPSNPVGNATTTQNGNTWKWNGTSWVAFNSLSLTSQVTGILAVDYGGTGFGGTFTVGDILYASSSNTFAKLAAGTAGSVLASGGAASAPYWKLDAQGVGSVSSGTQNELTYYDSTTSVTSAIGITLAVGTKLTLGYSTGAISTTTGAFIVYGGVGIGGSLWTGSSNYSSISGVGHQNGAITSGVWSGTAISIANGGTNGSASPTSGAVAYGTGSAYAFTLAGTSGSVLISQSTNAPIWVASSTLAAGSASTATRANTFDVSSGSANTTYYLTGVTTSVGTNAVTAYTSGTGVTFDTTSITTTTFRGTATNLSVSTITNNTSYPLTFNNSGAIGSTGAISAIANTGAIVATTFVGSVLGNVTGNLTGLASTATRVSVTTSSAGTSYLYFGDVVSGFGAIGATSSITVTPSSGTITATNFTGLAATATKVSITTTTNSTSYPITFSNTSNSFGALGTTGVISAIADTGAIVANTFIGNLSGTAVTATHYGSGANLTNIVTSASASNGINITGTGAITIGNTGVLSLQGTANQVLVNGGSGSATTGAITLTTPQNIGTGSSVTFANLTLSDGTNSTVATVGSQPTSMVNKQYVDNLASGLDIHGSVRLIQTGSALAANYVQTQAAGVAATGAYLISTTTTALPAIDGITISATGTSQRVLVNGGFTGTASIAGTTPFTPANSNLGNGIYYVASVGTGATYWMLIRATDTDDNVELTGGTFTFVEEGATYADSGWVCSNDTTNFGPISIGSTAITFTQFTGGGALSVGQGLSKVGNTLAVNANISSAGTNTAGKWDTLAIGGALSGVAGTGFYPTFQIATVTAHAGTATLSLLPDGFSLIGGTSSNRMLTVTGSGITLTGGGNTLTLTGSISLPSPTSNGIAYGLSTTAVAFLTASGSGASVLTQASGNAPVYLAQSQLFVGAATSAAQVNTDAQTSTRYLIGTANNTASASAQLSTGSGVYVGNNSLTSGAIAVTNNTGTAVTTGGALVVTGGVGIGGSLWTTATNFSSISGVGHQSGAITSGVWSGTAISLSNGGTNGTASGIALSYQLAVYNATGLAITQVTSGTASSVLFQSNAATAPSWVGQSQLIVGGATTSGQVSTGATTVTNYLIGTPLNTASSGGTLLFTGSGITIGNNYLTSGAIAVTNNTASTSTSTGALIVTGGVGIGGSLWTDTADFSSISGVGHQNGAITSGVWSGTAISLSNGGTNGTASGIALSYRLAVYNATGLAITQVASGTASSVLFQSNASTYPSWVGQSQLIVGGATTSGQVSTGATTVTNYLIGTPLNTASSGGTLLFTGSGITIGNNYLTSGGIAVTNSTVSTSTSSGALIVSGGVGIGGSLWTSTSNFSSISGVAFQNSSITSGVWSGTAISTSKGGTGLVTINPNELIIGASTGNTFASIGSSFVPVVNIGVNPPASVAGAIGNTQAGQLWWDSTYGVLKVYYNDGNTLQWVDATPVLGSSGGGSASKRSYVLSFGAGFTPSTGADTISIMVPYAPDNSSQYYYIKRLDYRNETASSGAGVSFYIERHTTGNASFTVANRIHSAAGASFIAAGSGGIFITSYTYASTGASIVSSSGVAGSVVSGDYLRLNFAAINGAATMSVSMVVEEQ